jgi:hypothetical protein
MIDANARRKQSPRSLAAGAVSFSFFGGAWLGRAVEQLTYRRSRYDWTESLLLGSAFLLYGIYWVSLLVKHARVEHGTTSEQKE